MTLRKKKFNLKALLLGAFSFLLISYIFYLPYKVVLVSTINSLNDQQLVLAKQAALGIMDFFHHYEKALVRMARSPHIITLDDMGKSLLEELYLVNQDEIRAITRVDATGHILFTFPYDQHAIGKDISGQEHNRKIIETHEPVVSEVFTAVQGYETLAYAIPVFDEGKYVGSLGILIPFEAISQKYLAGIVLGDDGYAWMLSQTGVELYCPVPGHVGKTIWQTSSRFPSVIDMAKKMMQGKQGRTVYIYDRVRGNETEVIKKHAVYYPVKLPGTFWSLVVATPESESLNAVRDFGKWWLAIFGGVVVALLVLLQAFLRFQRSAAEERNRLVTQEKLLEENRLFSRFMNNAHIPIVMVHVDGKIEFVNKKFQEIYGYTLDDIGTMKEWFARAYPDKELQEEVALSWREKLQEAIASGDAVTFKERAITCKDGSVRDVVFSYTLIDDRIVIILNDKTERNRIKQKEQELFQRQARTKKMEALGLMAGGVAHDLNNILSGIVSYPEVILMQLPEKSKLRGPIKTIHQSGLRAAAVVADLLTIVRGVARTRETYDLNMLILEYFDSPEFKKLKSLHPDVSFETRFGPDHLLISCSGLHIKKCLMNLITNAAESFGKKGSGNVVVATRRQGADEINNSDLHIHGEYAVVSVSDTGAGIPEKDLEHIFEPFYTKKIMGKSGTGLGLAVVWNTVEDHNGTITVNSTEKGTTFELFFPVSEALIEHKEKSAGPDDFRGCGEDILVVDDESLQRDIASHLLSLLGYSVHAVSSGEEAVRYLQDKSVHLVLLDMIMGPNMNGVETYKEIVKIHPGQKAIIASGFSKNRDVQQAIELGAGGFIKKPYSIELLGKTIKEELEN
ncbi:MAG: response regulator [Desulfobulbaceae bacterium]|nr:response regulator [Desulfobulbaceae bacterium]